MSIQTRLNRDRYSEYNIRLSYTEIQQALGKTSKTFLNYNTGTNSELDRITNRAIEILINPPKKDIYYHHNHSTLISDYIRYATPRSNRQLIFNKLIKPICFYILNQYRYNNTYEHIGISILTGIMFHMRKYILKCKGRRKEIPILKDRTSPRSHQYYPLYKPMRATTNASLRDYLFNISYDYCIKYLKYHKLL